MLSTASGSRPKERHRVGVDPCTELQWPHLHLQGRRGHRGWWEGEVRQLQLRVQDLQWQRGGGQLHSSPARCPQLSLPRTLALLTMLRTLCVWLCSGSGRAGMCTHSGTVTVPPSRSATITSSCGPKAPSGQGPAGSQQGLQQRRKQCGPHQLLSLCLEGGVDPYDEGRGRAEHLQELRR